MKDYLGEVINITDTKKLGRIKVRVRGWYDDLEEGLIPWALPRYISPNQHDLPSVGSEVVVNFMGNDIHHPVWFSGGHYINEAELSDDDYESASILLHKKLEDYNSSGSISIKYLDSEGFTITLDKSNTIAKILLGTDNTLKLESDGRFIHILKDMISLGKENNSSEPATLGNKNADVHDATLELIKTVVAELTTFLSQLATTATPNPYTATLAPVIASFIPKLQAAFTPEYSKIKSDIPNTKSTSTSLD